MTAGLDVRTYTPPGDVASQFLASREAVRFIKGPIGSGKTNLVFFDMITCASQMPKCSYGSNAGNRLFRGLILRENYTDLWRTTIPSWWQWFPEGVGDWKGSPGRQAIHKLRFEMPDGGFLVFEIWFMAIEDHKVEDVLRGIEFTMANMNEADRLAEDVLTYLVGRVVQRRFPPKRFFAERDRNYFVGVTGDLNPPDTDSWIYQTFEELQPSGHKMFHQPSGLSPRGENRSGVTLAEYQEIARLNQHRPWWVKRMVEGRYGPSRDGTPCFPEYDDDRHFAGDELKPLPGLGLRLGFDQGVRGPAMIVAQWTPSGQLRVLDELYVGRMGPTRFGHECRLLLESRYQGFSVDWATCDPAGLAGADTEGGDYSWHQIMEREMGMPIAAAPSQEIKLRHDGVSQLLRYSIDGRQPALIVSSRCKMLRKGFNSHYRFKVRKNGVETSLDPKPEKNEFADVHDALQYLIEDLMGIEGITQGLLTGMGHNGGPPLDDDEERSSVTPSTDFNVYAV
ncbi:hypothetical protein [Jiella avicenniae]|uniref:Terminase-like family protein n=1 Tax=Jiella avicenniae TaxID=2907202 RepID=A0A9X1NVS9_9HYPH|nr:hypothetical protein [Jiella avicenniae]MCE7026417.1 hypothetical protein [Jiella avicenniae]